MAERKGNGNRTSGAHLGKSPQLLALERDAQSPEALAADEARLRALIPDSQLGGVKRPFREGVRLIPTTAYPITDDDMKLVTEMLAKAHDKASACPVCHSNSWQSFQIRIVMAGISRPHEFRSCQGCGLTFRVLDEPRRRKVRRSR